MNTCEDFIPGKLYRVVLPFILHMCEHTEWGYGVDCNCSFSPMVCVRIGSYVCVRSVLPRVDEQRQSDGFDLEVVTPVGVGWLRMEGRNIGSMNSLEEASNEPR